MQIQDRDLQALKLMADCHIVSSRQLREWIYTSDKTGRVTRRRLTAMRHEQLVKKRNLEVINPYRGDSPSPVYHLDQKGLELLAMQFDDDSYLRLPTNPSQPAHLLHYCACSETQHMLRMAIEATNEEIELARWVGEDQPINIDESGESKTYIRRKFGSIACLPDAAMVLSYEDHKAVFYIEQDRNTYHHDRVAARKSKGFQKMWDHKGHLQSFPESNLGHFYVLVVTGSIKRRDQLRKSFEKRNTTHPVRKAYRFLAFDELKLGEDILFQNILTRCEDDQLVPLVKRVNQPTTNGQPNLTQSGLS